MASDIEKLITCKNKLRINKNHLRFHTDNYLNKTDKLKRENQILAYETRDLVDQNQRLEDKIRDLEDENHRLGDENRRLVHNLDSDTTQFRNRTFSVGSDFSDITQGDRTSSVGSDFSDITQGEKVNRDVTLKFIIRDYDIEKTLKVTDTDKISDIKEKILRESELEHFKSNEILIINNMTGVNITEDNENWLDTVEDGNIIEFIIIDERDKDKEDKGGGGIYKNKRFKKKKYKRRTIKSKSRKSKKKRRNKTKRR